MNSPSIYWKQYDEPKTFWCPIQKKDIQISGGYMCTDDRVKGFAIVGGMSALPKDGPLTIRGVMAMEDGSRWESEPIVPTPENAETAIPEIVSQAEQCLNTLDK